MAVDMIITEANASASAELIVRDGGATREQVAAAVLAQSPDWKQRVLGREIRAGLYAQVGAELQTVAALRTADTTESFQRYLERFPDMKRADWPVDPGFVPDFSGWKRDLAFVAGFVGVFAAIAHWWPL